MGTLATSPIAYTSTTKVRRYRSTEIPLSTAIPAAAATSVSGKDPIATTAKSAVHSRPSRARAVTPSAPGVSVSRSTPVCKATPAEACSAAIFSAIDGGSSLDRGSGCASRTCTLQPKSRAVDATSDSDQATADHQ